NSGAFSCITRVRVRLSSSAAFFNRSVYSNIARFIASSNVSAVGAAAESTEKQMSPVKRAAFMVAVYWLEAAKDFFTCAGTETNEGSDLSVWIAIKSA